MANCLSIGCSDKLFYDFENNLFSRNEADMHHGVKKENVSISRKIKKYRLEVTYGCNASCGYCLVYGNNLKQLNAAMDMNIAKKIVADYNNEPYAESIMLIGGEPLTNWPVVKYIIENAKG